MFKPILWVQAYLSPSGGGVGPGRGQSLAVPCHAAHWCCREENTERPLYCFIVFNSEGLRDSPAPCFKEKN